MASSYEADLDKCDNENCSCADDHLSVDQIINASSDKNGRPSLCERGREMARTYPVLLAMTGIVALGCILVYLETSLGKKLQNMTWLQLSLLVLVLLVAGCNIFVPSRLNRFLGEQVPNAKPVLPKKKHNKKSC